MPIKKRKKPTLLGRLSEGVRRITYKAWLFNSPVSVDEALKAAQANPGQFSQLKRLIDAKAVNKSAKKALTYLLRSANGHVIDGRAFGLIQGRPSKWSLTEAQA